MFSKTYQLLVRDIQKSNRTDNNKYYTYTIMKKKLNLILFVLFSIFSLNINAHDFEAVNSDGKTIYYNITSSEDLTVSVSYRGSSYISYINEYGGDISIPSSVLYNGETYSVTSIGDLAFFYCRNLTSITIPNSVTSIGDDAFSSCDGLTSINVDSNNPSYTSLNGVLFNKGKTELIKYPEGKEGSYTIPNSVTSIEDWAFYSCEGLTSITIPNSVTSIGNEAFWDCDGLTSVTIPNSVTSIGENAFYNCDDLTSVTIGNSVTSIGNYAFSQCYALTEIYSLSSDPAVCDAGSFSGVDKTIPVYIPFGSKNAYKSAAEWKEFTNFIESEFTGVEENEISASDIKVISGNGIEVNDYYGRMCIVNIAGQVIKDAYVNGSIQISLPKGIYIVVTENNSQKVIL